MRTGRQQRGDIAGLTGRVGVEEGVGAHDAAETAEEICLHWQGAAASSCLHPGCPPGRPGSDGHACGRTELVVINVRLQETAQSQIDIDRMPAHLRLGEPCPAPVRKAGLLAGRWLCSLAAMHVCGLHLALALTMGREDDVPATAVCIVPEICRLTKFTGNVL